MTTGSHWEITLAQSFVSNSFKTLFSFTKYCSKDTFDSLESKGEKHVEWNFVLRQLIPSKSLIFSYLINMVENHRKAYVQIVNIFKEWRKLGHTWLTLTQLFYKIFYFAFKFLIKSLVV